MSTPSLSALHPRSFAAEHAVAEGPRGAISWRQLLADVAATRSRVVSAGGNRWALYEPDSYRFTVGLLALLAQECRVYLPGDNHPAGIATLRAEAVRFIGDFPDCESIAMATGATTVADEPLTLAGEIVVHTSGSSGTPKLIAKNLRQLDAELALLEQQWGSRLRDARITGTVSHQHLYGLLFLVLWPLCSGRCFWHRPFIDPKLMAAQFVGGPLVAWIMSPAHLHRLDRDLPWAGVRDSLVAVFSSGGMLQREASLAMHAACGQSPIEVLGSSETGGIAWRQQSPTDCHWQSLPGIELRCGQHSALEIRSPLLADLDWYTTDDAVELLADGRFTLGPRLDRIVKIEGLRVALPEVETALNAHRWLLAGAALPLARRRQSIGAVLVLSEAGIAALSELGQQQFNRELRAQLRQLLPPAAVPRIWRIVPELPRNSQGKINQQQLLQCFAATQLPPVLRQQRTGTNAVALLYLPPGLPYFAGHFSETPVLPGVVQVHWAAHFGRELLAVKGSFGGMKLVKFQQLARPDTALTLNLEYAPKTGWLEFSFHSSAGQHSQGRLQFSGNC